MKPILKNRANLLTVLIMVQAALIFSCSEDGTGCYLQENEDGTNTITCEDSSFDFRSGLNGTDGGDGTDGKNGSSGKDGEDGEKGDQGDKGNKGSSGDKGSAGADGVKGKDGEKGEVGEDGDDGINEFTCLNVESEDGLLEDVEYDFAEQFCQTINPSKNRVLDLCGGTNGKAYVSTQFCQDGTNAVLQRCGNRTDSTGAYLASQFCQPVTNKVLDLCGKNIYEKSEFCQEGTSKVLDLCNGDSYLEEQVCQFFEAPVWPDAKVGVVVGKCGSELFRLETQRCGQNNIVETKCGEDSWYNYKNKTEYCKNATTLTQFGVLTDDRDGRSQTYRTVEIGTQTWMAQNLNYDSGEGTNVCNDFNESKCDIYGRLYEKMAAVDGAPGSNAIPSGVQGVCPDGWHIPSSAEWSVLLRYALENGARLDIAKVPALGEQIRDGEIAVSRLKSQSGWLPMPVEDYPKNTVGFLFSGTDFNGSDEFGFDALPGGFFTNSQFGSAATPTLNYFFESLGQLGAFVDSNHNCTTNAMGISCGNSGGPISFTGKITVGLGSGMGIWASVRCVQD